MPLHHVFREHLEVVPRLMKVVCNPCGATAEPGSLGGMPDGFHIWTFSGGYGDHFPADTETFEIVVCEACLRKWVESFTHKDVSRGAVMWHLPYPVLHSETGCPLVVDGCWLYPESESRPTGLRDPVMPDNYPNAGIWQHFKGKRYEVFDLAWDTRTLVPHVIYRALYEDSKVWARPLSEWSEIIERENYTGPRFIPVGSE